MARDQRVKVAAKKKSLHDSEREPQRVKQLREGYLGRISRFLVSHLKFIDESWINLGMTRLYKRATRGECVIEAIPIHRGTRLTILAAMGLSGVSAPWVSEDAVDGEVFEVYLKEVLGPTLEPGDIVVMDNLSVHKVGCVEAEINN